MIEDWRRAPGSSSSRYGDRRERMPDHMLTHLTARSETAVFNRQAAWHGRLATQASALAPGFVRETMPFFQPIWPMTSCASASATRGLGHCSASSSSACHVYQSVARISTCVPTSRTTGPGGTGSWWRSHQICLRCGATTWSRSPSAVRLPSSLRLPSARSRSPAAFLTSMAHRCIWGHPHAIGITDLAHPDYGDIIEVGAEEIPMFWACGVTPRPSSGRRRPNLPSPARPVPCW
jgi:hypothetical protein